LLASKAGHHVDMKATEGDVRVVRNDDANRYELYVNAELASIADYRRTGGTLDIHHTETRDGFRGRGLAALLIRNVLDDVRERRLTVVPSCWFVADLIEANPEYADLVA
jgi:predicted GNAT family acetyltransferase